MDKKLKVYEQTISGSFIEVSYIILKGRWLENGMDVRTLADILGHANANVNLNVYAHSMTEHKRHMMNNMQRVTVDE